MRRPRDRADARSLGEELHRRRAVEEDQENLRREIGAVPPPGGGKEGDLGYRLRVPGLEGVLDRHAQADLDEEVRPEGIEIDADAAEMAPGERAEERALDRRTFAVSDQELHAAVRAVGFLPFEGRGVDE